MVLSIAMLVYPSVLSKTSKAEIKRQLRTTGSKSSQDQRRSVETYNVVPPIVIYKLVYKTLLEYGTKYYNINQLSYLEGQMMPSLEEVIHHQYGMVGAKEVQDEYHLLEVAQMNDSNWETRKPCLTKHFPPTLREWLQGYTTPCLSINATGNQLLKQTTMCRALTNNAGNPATNSNRGLLKIHWKII